MRMAFDGGAWVLAAVRVITPCDQVDAAWKS
jgi:hypothetical protein